MIDNITIDNPIVIQSDSAVYISSEQLIDSLYGQDLAKSKYAYWMYTIDDTDNALSSLFLKSFRIAVKDIRKSIFYSSHCEDLSLRYLYYDFFDKYKETEIGIIYKFKRQPLYYIIVLTRPNCFRYSPDDLDIKQGDFQYYKLTIAPVFSKKDIRYFEKSTPSVRQNSINRYHNRIDKYDNTIPTEYGGYI